MKGMSVMRSMLKPSSTTLTAATALTLFMHVAREYRMRNARRSNAPLYGAGYDSFAGNNAYR